MLEDTPGQEPATETTDTGTAADAPPAEASPPAKKAAAKKATTKQAAPRKTAAKKTAAKKTTTARKSTRTAAPAAETGGEQPAAADAPATEAAPPTLTEAAPAAPVKKTTTRRRTTKKVAAAPAPDADAPTAEPTDDAAAAGTALLFQAPDPAQAPSKPRRTRKQAEPAAAAAPAEETEATPVPETPASETPASETPTPEPQAPEAKATAPETPADEAETQDDDRADSETGEGGESGGRRRRRRGGRRRRKSGGEGDSGSDDAQDEQDDQPQQGEDQGDGSGQGDGEAAAATTGARSGSGSRSGSRSGSGSGKGGSSAKGTQADTSDKADQGDQGDQPDGKDDEGGGESSSSRRRRRRRRSGDDGGDGNDDPQNTVTKVRQGRTGDDQITSLSGSTRLEAKKQRRREGREAGRRRAPIVSEAEFLARRESVDRVMAIRQRDDLTQIAVLEDKVLVEHYVARESQTSLIGNVYVGRVQNVLPSMEAAFIDIGKGRNAVLYAGEVNWSALGHKDGQPRKIESVLSSGQTIMVQVTKDPVGHKGARLTSQISLAGRFLVYVPDGTNSGISRKLPDTERTRLKTLLKEIVPDGAGVIVRTAAEGASEDELTRDVERLTSRWADIEKGAKKASGAQLLYGEPDLMLKVVRDLFTEDFGRLVVQGDDAWKTVQDYVQNVAPDLEERLEKHDGSQADLFTTFRIDEQIAKGLDRKVWLPSGGSLIIDRTEAMTVVDVNTGKFTGSGGNLEETVTKNNLEAAEEMVRQLRLRDIGGIIVIDFIDMVLESNRDLVLRRLVECLGRDRTRHQVAEVTSLGLVQMTRKRIGTGLLEAFSETCAHCQGRGLLVSEIPVEASKGDEEPRRSRRSRGGKGRNGDSGSGQDEQSRPASLPSPPSPKDVAAMARPPRDEDGATEPGQPEPPEESPVDQPVVAAKTEKPARRKRTERTADEPVEQPAVDAVPAAETMPDATPEESATVDAAAEPTAEEPPVAPPAEDAAAEELVAEATPAAELPGPASPTVVTRSRRRSARRPAGPPASSAPATTPPPGAVGSVGEPPESGVVEPGTAASEPPAVSHVPVKKRGSRKR